MCTKLMLAKKDVAEHLDKHEILAPCKKCGGEVAISWIDCREGWRWYRFFVDNLELGWGDGWAGSLYCCGCGATGRDTGWEVHNYMGQCRNPELYKTTK